MPTRIVFPGFYYIRKSPNLVGNPPTAAGLNETTASTGGGSGPPPPPTDPTDGYNLWGFQSFGSLGGITVITFGQATSLGGFDFEGDTELLELHFPNLVSIDPTHTQNGFLTVTGCTSLTILDMPAFVPNNGDTYNLAGNALTVTYVNNFLRRAVLNAGFTTGSIDLSGGTNAAPSGQGATDKATLIGRGVSVTTN